MSRGLGPNQRRILLLLAGGLTLALSRSPKQYFRVLRGIKSGLKEISERQTREAIQALYKSKLLDETENPDGSVTITLSESGNKTVLRYNLDDMRIKAPERWDGKWRMVIFDIPNYMTHARDALRFHLQELGFFTYQKSVFVHPYPCKKIMDFLIEYHEVRKYVRCVLVESLDNELHLKHHFGLQ